jgi:hypothetical protein
MALFGDHRLEPVDINNTPDFFPRVITPEIMALHMTRQWKAVNAQDEEAALNGIYNAWLLVYRQIEDWHIKHPSASPAEAKAAAEGIIESLLIRYGAPRMPHSPRSAE